VALKAPHRQQRHGNAYEVHMRFTAPSSEIMVSRSHGNLYVAIRGAFDAAERELENWAQTRHDESGSVAAAVPIYR
jgi:hypothetical protein